MARSTAGSQAAAARSEARGLPVVVVHDRRGLELAAVRGPAVRQSLTLIGEDGAVARTRPERVLHTLRATVPPGEGPAVRDALRALRTRLLGEAGPLPPEAFDGRLDPGATYDLLALARRVAGGDDDAAVLRVVGTFAQGGGGDGWLPCGLRLERGRFAPLEREATARIRAQRARDAARARAIEALEGWWLAGGGTAAANEVAGAAPPADAAPVLDELVAWALAGERAPAASAAKPVGRRLGLADPDAALAALEARGLVPRGVNEAPHRHGIPLDPPAAALAEAAAAAAAWGELARVLPAPRGAAAAGADEDLRALYTVAIDDPETREVDDAFSLWDEDGATWLAVHIAAVAPAVPPGGALDRDARRRATTVYFPDGAVPMLPLALVQGRLSLDAEVDRQAVSLVTRLGPDGLPGEVRFTPSRVRVARRLAYDLEGAPPEARALVERAGPLAAALRARRAAAGAVLLALPQPKLRIDEQGEPALQAGHTEHPAAALVSELMVLYNAELGRALAAAGLPAPYRTQPQPVAPPAGDPADPLFPVQARRGLPPTVVAPVPGPHRTMGLACYVQGTSPIRRYGDLVAQRQLLAHLRGEVAPHDRAAVEELLRDASQAERRAGRAADDRVAYWLARWAAAAAWPRPAVVSRADGGRLACYLPEADRELPLRAPPHGARLAVGDRVQVRPARCEPRRREVVLEALAPEPPISAGAAG